MGGKDTYGYMGCERSGGGELLVADVEGGTGAGRLSASAVPWVGESCREGGCAGVLCLGLSGGGEMLLYW